MKVTEPTTMVTDYFLALAVAFWAVRILLRARFTGDRPARLWAAGFFASACASLLGGTHHGFQTSFHPVTASIIWSTTLYTVVLASFSMLSAIVIASLTGTPRAFLLCLAAFKALAASVYLTRHSEFRYAIADYAASMFTILAFEVYAWWNRHDRGALWIIGGIAVALFAAGIQISRFSLHRHFNHNDLFHVIQIVAFYLLYRGGRLLKER